MSFQIYKVVGRHRQGEVVNFVNACVDQSFLFLLVQKVLKSTKKSQSYNHKQSGTFFYGSRCSTLSCNHSKTAVCFTCLVLSSDYRSGTLLYLLQSRVEYLIKWKGWGHKYVVLIDVCEMLLQISICKLRCGTGTSDD